MHISSATHGKKAGDGGHVDDYIHRHPASEGCVQQISKYIHICEYIHHHSNHLHTHTHRGKGQLVFPDTGGGFHLSCSYQRYHIHQTLQGSWVLMRTIKRQEIEASKERNLFPCYQSCFLKTMSDTWDALCVLNRRVTPVTAGSTLFISTAH